MCVNLSAEMQRQVNLTMQLGLRLLMSPFVQRIDEGLENNGCYTYRENTNTETEWLIVGRNVQELHLALVDLLMPVLQMGHQYHWREKQLPYNLKLIDWPDRQA